MPSAWIDDGYTLTGKVEALPGLYDGFSFCYRPALPDDVYKYRRAAVNKTPEQELRADIDHLVKHLVSWELKDARGNDVQITPQTMKRVVLPVLVQLLNHVNGYTAQEEDADLKN